MICSIAKKIRSMRLIRLGLCMGQEHKFSILRESYFNAFQPKLLMHFW